MYLFVRYGHLIRHGVAVPPTFARGKLAKFAARTLFSHDAMFAKQTCHGAKRSRKALFSRCFERFMILYQLNPNRKRSQIENTVTNSLPQRGKVAAACRLTDEVSFLFTADYSSTACRQNDTDEKENECITFIYLQTKPIQ